MIAVNILTVIIMFMMTTAAKVIKVLIKITTTIISIKQVIKIINDDNSNSSINGNGNDHADNDIRVI